ncbi:uncharacterized protein LOC133034364 [Cannabis sativa]|uniref:uncharacterized protein LOC133034364 n=1 Tax=Cannabis sativa TaxID=3483 RepID=UPI0029CA07E6|nr:uncharacterized protein LOC133034364 [Cannabis sativa]
MVKTRSSISPSHSVKIAADKKKMKNVSDDGDRGDSDRSGGSGGSSDGSRGSALQTKRKRVVEKVKKEDVRNEWDLYFKPGEKIQGKVMLFPNQDNIVVKNINSKLTKDQRKLFRGTCFGYFLDSHHVGFQSQLVHDALHREVYQKNEKEMWFKFGDENFRFSLAEFAIGSGLLCVGDADLSKYTHRENAFVDRYFCDQTVTVSAVEHRFMYGDFKSDEYAVKMVVLYLVTNCLISSVYSKKVPVEILNIIGVDEYGSFPWGIPVFELTLHNLKIGLRGVMKGKCVSKPLAKVKGKHLEKGPRSYKLPGLPFAFLVWLYETIPLCFKARFCSYDSGKPYRFCRLKSIGNPNSSGVEKKVLSSNKLKGKHIVPTENERNGLLVLTGIEFIGREQSDDDFDDVPLSKFNVDRVGSSGVQKEFTGGFDVDGVMRKMKDFVSRQKKTDESIEVLNKVLEGRFKELQLSLQSYIDSKISEGLVFFMELKFNELKEAIENAKISKDGNDSPDESDGKNDDLNDVEVFDVKNQDAIETVGLDENIQYTQVFNDDASSFDIMSFISSKPNWFTEEKKNTDKLNDEEQVVDDHGLFKDVVKKSKEDEDDGGDDQGLGGGDAVKAIGSGGINKDNVEGKNIEEAKDVADGSNKDNVEGRAVDVDASVNDVEGVASKGKLFDSQGTEDSITVSALEIINEKIDAYEGSIKKDKSLNKLEATNADVLSTYGLDKTDVVGVEKKHGSQESFSVSTMEVVNDHLVSYEDSLKKGKSIKLEKATPTVGNRERKPSFVYNSPYTTEFGSGSIGKPKGRRPGSCAFGFGFFNVIDDVQAKSFDQWFKIGFNDKNKVKKFKECHRKLKFPLDFVVCQIDDKMWFYDLLTVGKNLSCLHIDVCFYYLRKKLKYDQSVKISGNTTDCFFSSQIFDLYNEFVASGENVNSIKKDSKAAAYIAGFYMLCSKPWAKLDFVLMPVNVIVLTHWILCILDIKMRCLKVLNSMRFGRYKNNSESFVRAFAVIIPILLSHVNFYEGRKDIDRSSKHWQGKKDTDAFDIVVIDNLPQQEDSDCGVFIIKYAHFFMHGLIDKIPKKLDIAFTR